MTRYDVSRYRAPLAPNVFLGRGHLSDLLLGSACGRRGERDGRKGFKKTKKTTGKRIEKVKRNARGGSWLVVEIDAGAMARRRPQKQNHTHPNHKTTTYTYVSHTMTHVHVHDYLHVHVHIFVPVRTLLLEVGEHGLEAQLGGLLDQRLGDDAHLGHVQQGLRQGVVAG